MHGLDVMDVHLSQAQVSAQPLLPVQHVVCYLTQICLHSSMTPVQLPLEVRAYARRDGPHIVIHFCNKSYNTTLEFSLTVLIGRGGGDGNMVCSWYALNTGF